MKSLLSFLLLGPLSLACAQTPVAVNHYVPPKEATPLASTFVDWDSLTPRTTPAGEVRQVFDNPTRTLDKFEVHITTLNPGQQSHPVHRHAWEEMLLVKSGDFEINLNGHPHHAGPGALVFLASNDPHNARNVGSTPATYYVINFVSDVAHEEDGKSAAVQPLAGKLQSSVFDCDSLPTTPTKSGSRVVVVSSPTATFQALESHITTLNPGQHTDPDMIDHNDEFVVIRAGDVEVNVNGIASRMHAGSMMFWAANDKRSLRNVGSTPTSYQVIRVTTDKSPRPAAR